MSMFQYLLAINYRILIPALCIAFFGLITLYTFQGENVFFVRQTLLIAISLLVFFIASVPDYSFFRIGYGVLWVYGVVVLLLGMTYIMGYTALGARMSFDLGLFSLQPVEFAKIALVLILAKYFSMRHELIGSFRHIIISGIYMIILFFLTLLQPDFGSAMILAVLWFGIVLIAGIRFKHLAVVLGLGVLAFMLVWVFVFQDYQKERIHTFLDPLGDIQGAGYNAYQATIASGSGKLIGKGIGYGTQSKLNYLPEHQTDFIFASFAEEWGFVGAMMVFILFVALIFELIRASTRAMTNFERLFIIGIAIHIVSQFTTHVGMNIGVLPITGLPLPFMSFGGSHLVAEFLALGMVVGMTKNARRVIDIERADISASKLHG